MGGPSPGHEFELACRSAITAELRAEYIEQLHRREREVIGEVPERSLVDETQVTDPETGCRRMSYAWLKDGAREALDGARLGDLFDADSAGEQYSYDEGRLRELLDLFRAAEGGYLANEQSTRPSPDRRVFDPELRFGLEYIVPIEFGIEHEECGIGMVF